MSTPAHLIQTNELQTGYRSSGIKTITSQGPLSLELRPGQLICMLGPNGAGKSTLLKTLAGLHPPLQGHVKVAGEDIQTLTPTRRAKTVGLVLTDKVSIHHLTVYALVALGRYPWSGWLGGLNEKDREIIEWAIASTGINELRDRKVITLSDGESQKVMLARALAQDTPVLMLDEPTAHLDLPSRIRLMQLLHQLTRQINKGILLSTHELELALQIADEVWLLQDQGTLHRGAPEDLVLNGAFEAAFASDEIRFDKQTGTFSIRHEDRKPVILVGEGTAAWWTKRALQRDGFHLASSGMHPVVRVMEKGWQLENAAGTRSFDTIAALLQALK